MAGSFRKEAFDRIPEDKRSRIIVTATAEFACFLDNLFVMLQFSYACEYYQERFMVYAGRGVFRRDEDVIKNLLKFIRGAFSAKGE